MHNIVTSREKFIFLKNFFHENLSYLKKMVGLPASKSIENLMENPTNKIREQ